MPSGMAYKSKKARLIFLLVKSQLPRRWSSGHDCAPGLSSKGPVTDAGVDKDRVLANGLQQPHVGRLSSYWKRISRPRINYWDTSARSQEYILARERFKIRLKMAVKIRIYHKEIGGVV